MVEREESKGPSTVWLNMKQSSAGPTPSFLHLEPQLALEGVENAARYRFCVTSGPAGPARDRDDHYPRDKETPRFLSTPVSACPGFPSRYHKQGTRYM